MNKTFKKWLMPFIVVLVATGAGILLTFPMVNMEPREIPIAIVNLDEGIATPQGKQNAGGAIVKKLKETGSSNLVAWKTLTSQDEVSNGFENNDFYAAIVVPEDFTQSQITAQQGKGAARPLNLTIDSGKNPMVASMIQSSFSQSTSGSDALFDINYRNEIPTDVATVASVLPMVFMIIAYIGSYAGAITLRKSFPLGDKQRGKTVLLQFVLAVGLALLIGLVAALAIGSTKGLDASLIDLWLFNSIASFALINIVLASINWLGFKGMVIPILMLIIGLGTANLPYEFLPDFWQQFVYPWMPLRFIAEGVRTIIFQSGSLANAATLGLAITSAAGVVATVLAIFKPVVVTNTKKKQAKTE